MGSCSCFFLFFKRLRLQGIKKNAAPRGSGSLALIFLTDEEENEEEIMRPAAQAWGAVKECFRPLGAGVAPKKNTGAGARKNMRLLYQIRKDKKHNKIVQIILFIEDQGVKSSKGFVPSTLRAGCSSSIGPRRR